jgi:hypothetical protein
MNITYIIYGNNQQGLINQLKLVPPTEKHLVTVKPYKSQRSIVQNSRYWALLTGLGKHLGYEADEMHDIVRFKFMRNAIEIEGEKLPLLKSTTKLTTADMAELQDKIERWGHNLGYFFEE